MNRSTGFARRHGLVASIGLGSAVVAAALLTALPAGAHAAPFTVTAGSAPAGTTVSVMKVTTGAIAFKDTTTNQNLTCASARTTGSLRTGQSNGKPLVTFDGASVQVTGCTGPAGLKFAVTGYGTWSINVTDVTNGIATGALTDFRVHVTSTAGPACNLDLGSSSGSFSSSGTYTVPGGTLPGTYANATRKLTLPTSNPGDLGVWNVKGSGTNTYCVAPSIIKQGDRASLAMTLDVTAVNAAFNPIAIN